MKPETRRLIILDVILGIACLLEFFKGVTPWMWLPVLLSKLVLLGYGLWLLARKWGHGNLPD
jgi:hypothetical protein